MLCIVDISPLKIRDNVATAIGRTRMQSGPLTPVDIDKTELRYQREAKLLKLRLINVIK